MMGSKTLPNTNFNRTLSNFRQSGRKPVSVATGNWGCGAFRGDPQLKCLIQLMAASVCKRDVEYFTFDDRKLSDNISNIYNYLKEQSISVGHLYKKLLNYADAVRSPQFGLSLFDFLISSFESYNFDTAGEDESRKTNLHNLEPPNLVIRTRLNFEQDHHVGLTNSDSDRKAKDGKDTTPVKKDQHSGIRQSSWASNGASRSLQYQAHPSSFNFQMNVDDFPPLGKNSKLQSCGTPQQNELDDRQRREKMDAFLDKSHK